MSLFEFFKGAAAEAIWLLSKSIWLLGKVKWLFAEAIWLIVGGYLVVGPSLVVSKKNPNFGAPERPTAHLEYLAGLAMMGLAFLLI